MKLFHCCLPMLVLLAGCQSLGLRSTIATGGGTDQCVAPIRLPALDDSQNARQAWLNLQLELTTGPPMQQWRALQHYDITDSTSAELIAALVTSRAEMPEALRRLGQHTLQRQQGRLPATVQPIIDQRLQFNRAALERDHNRRQLQASQQQRLQLEADLAEKQRQIEALTAIESQLRDDALSTPPPANPGDANAR